MLSRFSLKTKRLDKAFEMMFLAEDSNLVVKGLSRDEAHFPCITFI